jgi:hypothetical protein
MIIKRNMAVDSLTRVCEESLALIKQLIDADNEVYAKGFEDGMVAQSEVHKTLRPWVGLTNEDFYGQSELQVMAMKFAEAKLKEKNT